MTLAAIDKNAARATRHIVRQIIAKGYNISVNDDYECNGEWVVRKETDYMTIVNVLASTEGDFLRIRDAEGANVGCLVLIYESDSVIADCSVSMNWVIDTTDR